MFFPVFIRAGFVYLLLSAVSTNAEPLTRASVLQFALNNNPNIMAAHASWQAEQARVLQTWALPPPELELEQVEELGPGVVRALLLKIYFQSRCHQNPIREKVNCLASRSLSLTFVEWSRSHWSGCSWDCCRPVCGSVLVEFFVLLHLGLLIPTHQELRNPNHQETQERGAVAVIPLERRAPRQVVLEWKNFSLQRESELFYWPQFLGAPKLFS